MFIARIPNRNSPPAILLRESYRQAGKVKTRTLANLSKLPADAIEVLRQALKGDRLVVASDAFEVIASLFICTENCPVSFPVKWTTENCPTLRA